MNTCGIDRPGGVVAYYLVVLLLLGYFYLLLMLICCMLCRFSCFFPSCLFSFIFFFVDTCY